MTWHVTLDYDTYEEARKLFEWDVPNEYNIAWDLLRKHDDPHKVALFQGYPDGSRETYTFRDIDIRSNKLANALAELGVGKGDRVALNMPQIPEYPITHLACWKLGAVSVPISVLYGESGLQYRVEDSKAKVAVVDGPAVDTIEGVRADCPDLEHVVEVDREDDGGTDEDRHGFEALIEDQPREFSLADTDADTPAVIMYTSGTTGPPKGVLHTHGVWIGHYPGFSMAYGLDVLDATVYWSPVEWSWFGTLSAILCPAWHYGRPVVGYPMEGFDPNLAFEIMEEFGVTDALFPPTAVRMMMEIDDPTGTYDLSLDNVFCGGEPVTTEIHGWIDETFDGVTLNEGYGRTEGTTLVSNCGDWFDAKPGSMGKPVVGHEVAILDPETGEKVDVDEYGEIAVKRGDDPALFEEYWKLPDKTKEGRMGEWDLTGDLAKRDEDGYIWFKTRVDDVIITSGYRVGPGSVEDAVLEHPDVEQAGVIGIPDETRGEIIKAFVKPISGSEGDDTLREEIRDMVRERLAKHEYPREIEFMDELPQTTTGKIRRAELREREGVE
jgi:acetyl-CoA synthetase